jgi:carbon storage regulator
MSMLVLTRKTDERVILHRDGVPIAKILVAKISGDSVKLGFDCPGEIKVHREEIFNEIIEEKLQEAGRKENRRHQGRNQNSGNR